MRQDIRLTRSGEGGGPALAPDRPRTGEDVLKVSFSYPLLNERPVRIVAVVIDERIMTGQFNDRSGNAWIKRGQTEFVLTDVLPGKHVLNRLELQVGEQRLVITDEDFSTRAGEEAELKVNVRYDRARDEHLVELER